MHKKLGKDFGDNSRTEPERDSVWKMRREREIERVVNFALPDGYRVCLGG